MPDLTAPAPDTMTAGTHKMTLCRDKMPYGVKSVNISGNEKDAPRRRHTYRVAGDVVYRRDYRRDRRTGTSRFLRDESDECRS